MQENILKTTQQIDEIASASQEQLKGIEQINAAIIAIEKGLQQSSEVADELVKVMGQFRTQQTEGEENGSSAFHNIPMEKKHLASKKIGTAIPRIAAS